MNERSSGSQDSSRRRLERAVVLELLASEQSKAGVATAELQRALGATDGELDAVVRELADAGVLEASGATVRASTATRRLDGLELIGI